MFSNVKDWRCGHELEEIGYIMFEIDLCTALDISEVPLRLDLNRTDC